MRSKLSRQLRRFRREEDGLIMTEFLIMLPLLIWTFMALFVYWDIFRTINHSQKASFAVSDLISRQSEIDIAFVNGMKTVIEHLSNGRDVDVRISSVEWDEDDGYRVLFSRSPGNTMPAHTDASITNAADRIPVMADNESVVIVETRTPYEPAFNVGLNEQVFSHFVVTRPRYFRRVCLIEEPCPDEL